MSPKEAERGRGQEGAPRETQAVLVDTDGTQRRGTPRVAG